MSAMKCIEAHVLITGRVQGVFFRASAKRVARNLEVGGWIRNLPDGRVQCFFRGREDKVRAMIDWCKKGPPNAVVTDITAKEEPSDALQYELMTFEIR